MSKDKRIVDLFNLNTDEIWEKVWSKVRSNGDCWIWMGRTERGYGRVSINGRGWWAHRLTYTLAYGVIEPGLFVLHNCDNPPCVNPNHLRLGTQADNNNDIWARNRKPNVQQKLSAETVEIIRVKYASGCTQTELANDFHVRQSVIQRMVTGQNYRSEPGPISELRKRGRRVISSK